VTTLLKRHLLHVEQEAGGENVTLRHGVAPSDAPLPSGSARSCACSAIEFASMQQRGRAWSGRFAALSLIIP
jgi:hypothetical protein